MFDNPTTEKGTIVYDHSNPSLTQALCAKLGKVARGCKAASVSEVTRSSDPVHVGVDFPGDVFNTLEPSSHAVNQSVK